MQILNIPKSIYIYDEGMSGFDFRKIKKFIKDNFGGFKAYLSRLKQKPVRTHGLLFDFAGTQKAFSALRYSRTKDACHIILTPRLFATYDEQKKIHIRAAIFGFPSVISTSGIVEGPAKPKDYYVYKQRYSQLGIWEIEEPKVKQRFKGHFIDYADKRLPEVIKGYISQAIFFYLTGQPFCKNKNCRLFNAHWQNDLIYSQIKSGKFCKRHKSVLEKIKSCKNFT